MGTPKLSDFAKIAAPVKVAIGLSKKIAGMPSQPKMMFKKKKSKAIGK